MRLESREKRSGSLKVAKEPIHPVVKPIKGFEVEPSSIARLIKEKIEAEDFILIESEEEDAD